MKTAFSLFSCSVLLTAWAAADLPQKPPLTRYSKLWSNSPFTAKPPPAAQAEASNPLDDYALIGVSPIGSGSYRVTLINKKQPDERITVDSNSTRSDFKILGVTRKQGDPLGTVVRMQSGSMTGTVSFDEKLLTLAAPQPPQVAPQPQIPGQPPQPQNGQVQPVRQPRPRVVPPPTPQAAPAQPAQQNRRQERRRN